MAERSAGGTTGLEEREGAPVPAAEIGWPRLLSAWVPVLLFEALVFYLSSRPNLQLPASIPYLDKGAHFLEYLGAGGLVYRALRLSGRPRPACLALALVLVAALGGIDELLQRGVPGRSCSLRDWIADLLGATTGVLLARGLESRLPRWLWTLLPAGGASGRR